MIEWPDSARGSGQYMMLIVRGIASPEHELVIAQVSPDEHRRAC